MVLGLGDLEKGKKISEKNFAGKSDNTKNKKRQLKSGQTVTLGSASFKFANNELYRIKRDGQLAKEPISRNTLTYKNIMNPKNTRVQVQTGPVKTNKSALASLMATLKSIKSGEGSGLKIAENKTNNKPKEKVKVTEKKPTGAESWRNYKTVASAQKAGSKFFMGSDGKKKIAVTKEQLKKSGLSLREYANKIAKGNKVKASKGALLKQPDNPGLKKLPTQVRNKMGFMKKGGNVGHTDYRKASKGMLLISVDMMKKKKKNK